MRLSAFLLLLAGACSATPGPTSPIPSSNTSPRSTLAPNPSPSPNPNPNPNPTSTPSSTPAPIADPELPAGTVVVHVGDSMADALGKELEVELKALGIRNPHAWKEATYIPQWASKFDKMGYRALLAQNNPDLVIITLGGNELAMPNPQERAEPIREMVKAAGDRPCLWIAAPLWPDAKNTGLFDVIKANCAPCIFVDTNAMLKLEVLSSDHVHPTLSERKRWAKFMIRWLRHNRDPNGAKAWSFKAKLEPPPDEGATE